MHRYLFRQHGGLRPDGARRADLDQEHDRSNADLPPFVPRGCVRLLRDEYRRWQHAGLHQGDERNPRADQDLSAAAPAGGERPRTRSHQFLRAIRLDPALPADREPAAAEGVEAEPRGPREARRALRMHSVRLLLDLVPELLVEL